MRKNCVEIAQNARKTFPPPNHPPYLRKKIRTRE